MKQERGHDDDRTKPDDRQPWANFRARVAARERRRQRALHRGDRTVWLGMGMFGLVGWSVALPTVAGLIIGRWLDFRTDTGISWTLALMLAGLTFGLINVWNWMQKSGEDDAEDEPDGEQR